MNNPVRTVDARALKAMLRDGAEVALLDAREERIFAARHLLLAACVPFSRLEITLGDSVPRHGARVVWCDDGEGLAARAAARTAGLGYGDVSVLEGGIDAWAQAGYRVYSGVHVPSKAFAEVVEHEASTPWITAEELHAWIEGGADIAVFDSRSYEEYHNNSIPTAISCPGAELVYRFEELVPSPETTVVVNCGGRTRSIIGAQSLINARVPNKVVSMKDGTMAWHLAGLEVAHGADRRPPEASEAGLATARERAAAVAARAEIASIDRATLEAWRGEADRRSLYVLDVRTPEEYAAGHLPGSRSAPGGQLVQETDSFMATWGARAVLVDDNGVRARMTASWLRQMGWDVAVLDGALDGPLETGPWTPTALGLEDLSVPTVAVPELRAALARGGTVVVDVEFSKRHGQGHIPGAWFAIRARLGSALARLPATEHYVVTSADGVLAHHAAADLAELTAASVAALAGGTRAWAAAGEPLEAGLTNLADETDDVQLTARELGENREEAMRAYLAWEIDLVHQMSEDDDHRFQVMGP